MTDFPDLPGHFAAGVRHRQSLVDAELDEKFQAAACGPNGTSPAATYGYHDGSLLMRDPQSLPIVQRLGYQQRTQRPGQVSFPWGSVRLLFRFSLSILPFLPNELCPTRLHP